MTRSYCVICDEEACDHTGPRYLDPVVYTLIEGDNPKTFRWKASDEDRERMESGTGVGQTRPADKPLLHADLLAAIEKRRYVDGEMESLLNRAYQNDPLRTSRAVTAAVADFDGGRIKSFGGILAKWLREIQTPT